MSRAALRRELEQLKRDSGWYQAIEAEIKAAKERQRMRFTVVEHEIMGRRMIEGLEQVELRVNFDMVIAEYQRSRQWLDEEDTEEQWQADHDLLVALEIEQYGEVRDIARHEGWGGNRIEMGQHFFDKWDRFLHVEHLEKERHEKLHELWLEAEDGRGVLTEKSWLEKHRAHLDQELPPVDPFSRDPPSEVWRKEALRHGWM
jgi:hypothetical protein